MKIFDCFMYFDEEIVLDLRLNTLNRYVDYFVIVESTFTHRGDKRNLKFNHKKFEKFKDKIIYLTFDKEPDGIEVIYENDSESEKSGKYILGSVEVGVKRAVFHEILESIDDSIARISATEIGQVIVTGNLDMLGVFEHRFPNNGTSETKLIQSHNGAKYEWNKLIQRPT